MSKDLYARHAKDMAGKRAVVTGASSGIGRATAIELARRGASVVVHYCSSAEGAKGTMSLCEKVGGEAVTFQADLLSYHDRHDMIEKLWACGHVDYWVNNAGADVLTGGNRTMSFDARLASLIEVDIKATVTLSRGIGNLMQTTDEGAIVNVGWDHACCGLGGESGELFAVAKGAIEAFSKSLARSLAPKVRVNCVAPGWIRTAWGAGASDAWQQRVLSETPLARWGEPEDVARAIAFLLSDEASFITGQTLRVNGGAVRL
jgi:3-oxoacyl-[acyl-carrier protein] reductase